jgi:hypothetical protein
MLQLFMVKPDRNYKDEEDNVILLIIHSKLFDILKRKT